MAHENAVGTGRLPAEHGGRLHRMTICRVAFVLMCFAPQLRYLMPQLGLVMLLCGALLAYVSLPLRASRSSIFFGAYFLAFGLFGLLLRLLGDVPPGMPPARPLYFYALTALALVLTGLAIMRRQGGREFVLNVLCTVLVVEIAIVGLQFLSMSYGIGLTLSDEAIRDNLIQGSYGNPNNVAVVLAMLLMVLVMSGHVRMSSILGAALVIATLAATFVTLSRTALLFLALFLASAVLAPDLRCLRIAAGMRAVRRALPVLIALGAALLVLQRSEVITSLEDLAVVQRSLERVATLAMIGQEASLEWRAVVASRLIEGLDTLGFGTLSDQNYGEFFQPLDPSLAAINPHSYLVEMSFLFGYPGLFMALAFLAVTAWRIIAARGRRLLAVLFGMSLLFFQMVPSSLFSVDMFFLIVAIAGTQGLQSAPRLAPHRRWASSVATSEARIT